MWKFFSTLSDLQQRVVYAEHEISRLETKLYNLTRKHYALLDHLELTEKSIPEATKLVPKKGGL